MAPHGAKTRWKKEVLAAIPGLDSNGVIVLDQNNQLMNLS